MTLTDSPALREATGPRLGLAHLLRLRSHPDTHTAWLRERYGEVYTLRVFGVDMHVAHGPDAFEQVFVNRDKVFASGPAWSHFIGPFFHRGLMLLDAEEHLHHRRIMQHAFGQDELRRYHRLMLPHLRRHLAAWEGVENPRLQQMFKALTLDLALEVFVGVDLDDAQRRAVNRDFVDAVRAGTAVVRRPLPGGVGPWSRGLAARARLERFFREALPAKRREGGEDLFARLCAATDDHGNEFSDDDVVDHMIFLLMAAHDTTTTTLTSMAYQLARHPRWQDRCREESLAAPEPDVVGTADLPSLDLVMKESLRLCAPVPSIPRIATRETSIGGYRIPAGAFVTTSPYTNQHDAAIWPDPQRFDPERFAPHRREDKAHRLAFQSFGAGVHKCIGMHFAGMQVRAVLHELLTRYTWSVPPDYRLPIDLTALPVATDGLPVRLVVRTGRST
ncbi:cytochrome P450 [Nocardioides nanhaiensis]|uniref:Cytochrome P450 n=1 Tax=Nocardioides nanhaiensis TaxID=1476871 RepID=A0ABP8WUR5_9ACTN